MIFDFGVFDTCDSDGRLRSVTLRVSLFIFLYESHHKLCSFFSSETEKQIRWTTASKNKKEITSAHPTNLFRRLAVSYLNSHTSFKGRFTGCEGEILQQRESWHTDTLLSTFLNQIHRLTEDKTRLFWRQVWFIYIKFQPQTLNTRLGFICFLLVCSIDASF